MSAERLARKNGEQAGAGSGRRRGKRQFFSAQNRIIRDFVSKVNKNTLCIFSCRIDALASVIIIALELVSSKYANRRVGRGEESHKTRA